MTISYKNDARRRRLSKKDWDDQYAEGVIEEETISARKTLDEIAVAFQAAMRETEAENDRLVRDCDYDTKLAVTAWVMKHVVEHAKEGGSYRYLIYDRLGFGPDSYAILMDDGITISNEFDLNLKGEIAKVVIDKNYDELKTLIGLCDEPGCFKPSSCGWPSDEGYRRTCLTHMKDKDNTP